MPAPSGSVERVVEAARELIASDGDPEFYAFLETALHEYDDVVACERAWVGDWPYTMPGGVAYRREARNA